MAAEFVRIVCAGCGAEVDKVEYDPDATNPAVAGVASALGVSEDRAREIVAAEDPDAVVPPKLQAATLAQRIVDGDVPDRDTDTYACPNGCVDAGLEVSEEGR